MKALNAPFLGFHDEESLRAFADALPHGLFTTDVGGRVTYWNAAAERLTGWTRAEAIGKSCSLLTGDVVNGCACGKGPLKCGLATSGTTSKNCTIRTKQGMLIPIVKNAVAVRGPTADPIGALEVFTAIGAEQRDAGRGEDGDFFGLVGRAPAMQDLFRLVRLVAVSDATVMLLGESGTGKDRIADAIHRLSPRSSRTFVRVACGALSPDQMDVELFGHPGGMGEVPRGKFEEANGGTLFLDGVCDLSPIVQAKLLRVLEEKGDLAGSSRPAGLDVRVLCATDHPLREAVEARRFRADLFFRLNVFPVRLPPLRDHLDDLPAIVERFLQRMTPRRTIAPEAMSRLLAHDWPGNVRELESVLRFAALHACEGAIRPEHFPHGIGNALASAAPADQDRSAVAAALARCGGVRAAAARELGISRVTLWKRMKRYRLLERPPQQ